MGSLWRWISLRHLYLESGRTLLTVLGVALGVAVYLAIRLANHSAMASFAATVDAVAGKANLQVAGDSSGFDERLYPKIRALPGVIAAAPVVQAYALTAGLGDVSPRALVKGEEDPHLDTVLVLGIDPFAEAPFGRFEPAENARLREAAFAFLSDPRAAAVTRKGWESLTRGRPAELGAPLHLVVSGRSERLHLRHILESQELQQAMGGQVLIVDIATAQEIFRRYGRLDRIDLIVEPHRREAVAAAIRALAPPNVRVTQPQGRTRQVENMVSAFELNLTALSFIALFVSMFLIFNAVSMAVLRRRREIGILRSLGVTRAGIRLMFLFEGLFVGAVGGLAGLALGTLLARAALGAVAGTLSTLYLVVNAREVVPDPGLYVTAFAVGIGMSLLSALAPAIEASATDPAVTTRQGILIEAQRIPIGRLSAAGLGILVLAAAVALWTVAERRPAGGFVSAFLLLAGFSLLAPGFTLLCERLASPPLRAMAGIEGMLGARYLRESLARSSVAIAALMVSVGMLVGLTIMVGSFRRTVSVWVEQTLRGDLYVEPVGRQVSGSATRLPDPVVQAARRLPAAAAVDTYRAVEIAYNGRIAYCMGIDFDVQAKHGRLQFANGPAAEILTRARREDGVVVTESFSYRHRVRPGDTVTLETPAGRARLRVEGVFYDYSTDAGAVLMDYRLYRRLWNDSRTESLAIYLHPGMDPDAARREFIRRVGSRYLLYVTPNQALRRRVLVVFDQTFRITYALQAIAIVVAVLGVVSNLTALIVQRGREIGVLRAVGALRRQVHRMVLVESGLLGLIGALLGCGCGLLLSLLLTYVINKQFFGWSIRLTVDPWLFVQATALMVATALLAGVAPARMAAGRLAAEAMRVE